jgi:hypothetical protein
MAVFHLPNQQVDIQLNADSIHVYQSPTADGRVLHTDPPALADPGAFMNRDDVLLQLAAAISDGTPRIGVWGPPGIGKTTLVQHFFQHHNAQLYDPIWLRADELFDRHPDGRDRHNAQPWERETLLNRVKRLREERPRSIFVIDNAQAAREEIGWLSSRLEGSTVLFLSWDIEALPRCGVIIRLHPLPSESAQQLMAYHCGPERAREHAAIEELCRLLGNHPLALDLAGRRLQLEPSLRTAELVDELHSPRIRLTLEGPTVDRARVQIHSILSATYSSLSSAEQRVLSSLAAVPAIGISEETMAYVVAQLASGEVRRLRRSVALGLLMERLNKDWRGHRYHLHSLIADFLRDTEAYQWDDLGYDVSGHLPTYRCYVVIKLAFWTPPLLDLVHLRTLLHDPDPNMRAAAAQVAGQERARVLIPDLQSLLEDYTVADPMGQAIAVVASEALDRIAGKRERWRPTPPEKGGIFA